MDRTIGRIIPPMVQQERSRYQALAARDSRFDGTFFVGVTSTGIYCRPVCPAKTPKAVNCRFFDTAQQAEQAHFRPCLRCRPELAPGNAPVDDSQRIAQQIVQRLEDGTLDEETDLSVIAGRFELSTRQIRRVVQQHFGVSPIKLLSTRRLLLAKQLLTETRLPVTDVAFASGFSSLRRFNDAFSTRYGMPPSRLRREVAGGSASGVEAMSSRLQLVYRPPYDWAGVLEFLSRRAIRGVELVADGSYARTVRLGRRTGWFRITHDADRHALLLEFPHVLTPVLPSLLARVRHLFDLDARPDLICAQLKKDELLAARVRRTPGMRVPGAFHGFELGLRAILGQQVSVKAATTLAGRLAETFGEKIPAPFPGLDRLSPEPQALSRAKIPDIASLGVVRARATSILALARAHCSGDLQLDGGSSHDPQAMMRRLMQIPGIGPWTAHYIVMRALRWPDAFPKEDIVLRKVLGGVSARQAEEISQAWRPWRSYAVLHLWR